MTFESHVQDEGAKEDQLTLWAPISMMWTHVTTKHA